MRQRRYECKNIWTFDLGWNFASAFQTGLKYFRLLPTTRSPEPEDGFDPATYVVGPEEEFPRKLEYFTFVMHAPDDYFYYKNAPYPTDAICSDQEYVLTRLGPKIRLVNASGKSVYADLPPQWWLISIDFFKSLWTFVRGVIGPRRLNSDEAWLSFSIFQTYWSGKNICCSLLIKLDN